MAKTITNRIYNELVAIVVLQPHNFVQIFTEPLTLPPQTHTYPNYKMCNLIEYTRDVYNYQVCFSLGVSISTNNTEIHLTYPATL